MDTKIIIRQQPGENLKFEYFLTSIYETCLNIYQNGAKVFNANIDIKPTGTYDCGHNSSGFNIDWTLEVLYKVRRGGGFHWIETNMVVAPISNPNLFQVYSYITNHGNIQNSTINVDRT